MNGDWFGLPQRRVGHEGLEVAAPGPHLARPRHTLSQPPATGIVSASPYRIVVCPSDQSLKVGGPILASNPGSILASAEAGRSRVALADRTQVFDEL